MKEPVVVEHESVQVVRDDLYRGGTKARFLPVLFESVDEVVYAGPQEGGAQTALAHVAAQLGKRATLFVAKRKKQHPRVKAARELGAWVVEVYPGYLNQVKARAREYCQAHGAGLAPFGVDLPEALDVVSRAALSTGLEPDEVWCAGGSGVLARSLARAWPETRLNVVEVGRSLDSVDVGGATVHKCGLRFGQECKTKPPFPSDPHYDAKAWEVCQRERGSGLVVFWNVTGPACQD